MSNGAKTRVERTRKCILAAATELFLKQGYLGTNMDEIAALAEVSKQTVYAHFQNKETLFLEIAGGMTGRAGDEHQEQVADPADTVPLAQFLLEFADVQLTLVMTPRLLQLRRLAIAEAERFPELGKLLYQRGPMRSINRLANLFQRYRALGQLRMADPLAAAAFFNWLVMGGPVNDVMLLGIEAIPKPEVLRAHAKEAVRIFLAAYGSDA
ncbi:TetR/AcrR family transcriptional regulator [Labrys neptuniae]